MLGLWLRNLLRRPLCRPLKKTPSNRMTRVATSGCCSRLRSVAHFSKVAWAGAGKPQISERRTKSGEASQLKYPIFSEPFSQPFIYPLLILHGIWLSIFRRCGPEAEPSSPKWESKAFPWADICWKVKWLWIGLALGKGRCEASARLCKSFFCKKMQDHFWVKMTSDQGQPESSDVKIVLYSS